MKKIGYIGFFISLFSTGISWVSAQDRTWEKPEEGEIQDASFVVEKNRQIELPIEARKFEKIPPQPTNDEQNQVRPYAYKSILPGVGGLKIRNRALKLREEPLEKFYGGNLSAGFGNYNTPYLDFSLFNKREDRYQVGFNASHLSSGKGPVDKENSGDGKSRLAFDSKVFNRVIMAGFNIFYDRSFNHFYGYPEGSDINEDNIRQIFNRYGVGLTVENNTKDVDFTYRFAVDYHHIDDRYGSSESDFGFKMKTRMNLDEDLDFSVDGDINLSSYNYMGSINRNLIRVKPYIRYRYDQFLVTAGLNFAFQNDTLSTRGSVVLYPEAGVDYFINDYFTMFLKLDGDMEPVSYDRLAEENPYLQPGIPLLFSNRQFGMKWGLTGNVANWFNFTAGVAYSAYKDLYFYLNDSTDISRFDVLYEHDNTSVTNLFGELVFSRIKNYHISLRGDLFNYSTKQLAEPWHRPGYKLTLDFQYNLYDKIYLGSSIYFMGGIKAFDWINDETITLSGFSDINLDIQYFLSERLGAFLRFNNILGNNYEKYWRYPARGIQGMFGFSYNF